MSQSGFHIRCQRSELVQALQAADAVVPSSSAKPILTNLLLDAQSGDDGTLEIAATDLQVGLRSVLGRIDILHPGQVVVPARKLVSVLKESRSASVEMYLQEHGDTVQLIIELSDGSYRLPAVMGETFPQVTPYPDDGTLVTIPAEILALMIRKTLFAVDRERTSAVLSGVLLTVNGEEVVLAATDGKVLAEFRHPMPNPLHSDSPAMAIIPAATMSHLQRILDGGARGSVEVAVVGKLIFVRIGVGSDGDSKDATIAVELTSRCIEGSYPPYRNALPSGSSQTMTFEREELSSAVRRTALMTSSASPGIVLSISNGQAELSNLFNTSGTAQIPLQCSYQGDAQRFGFNAVYLSNVLKALTGDQVTFELNGAGRGIITRDGQSIYLVMPISLPNQ